MDIRASLKAEYDRAENILRMVLRAMSEGRGGELYLRVMERYEERCSLLHELLCHYVPEMRIHDYI